MGEEQMKLPAKLTASVLAAWRERMGYSQRDAATALGCSRAAWAGWESGKQPQIPRYIGLACAALALGMKPYGATQSELIGQ
jgi:transcriptional regulator with XRE-family HTH domain